MAGIVPGNIILKGYRNPFIMVMGLIPGNVRLTAIGTHLLAIWTQNSHIISVASYGSGYSNTYHTGKCLGMRLSLVRPL